MISITLDGWIIVFISIGIAIASSLVRKATLDMEKLKESKEKIKEHQKIIKEATKKGHTKKAMKSQEEMTKLMMENFRHSMKPMMITIIPFILVFGWLAGTYGDIRPAENVIIVDILPSDIKYLDVNATDNGTFNDEDNIITWFIGTVHTDSTEKVSVNLTVNPSISDKDSFHNIAILYYTEKDGTKGPTVFSNLTEPIEGAVMTIEKEYKETELNNEISYDIIYRNIALHNVVEFPLKVYIDIPIPLPSITKIGENFRIYFNINNGFGWLMWYILCSLISSLILNKLMKLS